MSTIVYYKSLEPTNIEEKIVDINRVIENSETLQKGHISSAEVVQFIEEASAAKTANLEKNLKETAYHASVDREVLAMEVFFNHKRRLAKILRVDSNVTEEDLEKLGMTVQRVEVDTTTLRPVFTATVEPGLVLLNVELQHMNTVNIYSQLPDQEDFPLLATITRHIYKDRRPKANPNLPEKRLYKAVYVNDEDEETGIPSEIIAVNIP